MGRSRDRQRVRLRTQPAVDTDGARHGIVRGAWLVRCAMPSTAARHAGPSRCRGSAQATANRRHAKAAVDSARPLGPDRSDAAVIASSNSSQRVQAVDRADERRVDAVAEHAAMSSETVRAISRDTDRVKASIGRSHGWQYCAVTARRSRVVVLAPPPCQRVPTKNTHEPAGMTTGSD